MSVGVIEVQRDVRAFVVNQLALQLDAGTPLPAALQAVHDALPDEYRRVAADFERLIAGGAAPADWSQLEKLLRAARDHGVAPEKMLSGYARAAHAARLGVSELLSGATSLAMYLLLLSFVLMIVAVTYSIFVLPQMRTLFTALRARLPEFTEVMIGGFSLLLPVLVLLFGVLALYVIGLRRLRRRLQALEPVYPLLRRVPGLAQWARLRDETLWLRYFALFLDAGAPDRVARGAADWLAGELRSPHRLLLLDSAARLGHVPAEIARVLDVEAREDVERFEQSRSTFILVLRLLVYAVIATYVIAMYLPIFKLGGTV